MNFLTSMQFTKPLGVIVTPDNEQQILEFIKQKVIEEKAQDVVIRGYKVVYKGADNVSWQLSVFTHFDRGEYEIVLKDNRWYLNCKSETEVSFDVLLITCAVFGCIFFAGGFNWFSVFALFIVLFWDRLFGRFRHEIFVGTLYLGLKELINGKEPEVEKTKESEKLKSWF